MFDTKILENNTSGETFNLNPFLPTKGENLTLSYVCDYHSLLICEWDISNIDREVVIEYAKFWHDHYLITKFMRPKPHLN
jgi:hypothetical protein